MNDRQLEVVGSPAAGAGMMVPTSQVQAQLAEMHRLVESVLVENVHYGVIPGTKTNSLLKPGAEVLFKAFLCSPRHRSEVIEIDRANRFVMIQVFCEAVHVPSGLVLAEGMGAASSEKWADTKVDFGWLYNSTLKIAEKRAEVDCTLKLGAVSAHFTQDMEDYAPGDTAGGGGAASGTGAAFPILRECPTHNLPWRAGKFGPYHMKTGGGFCNLKDVLGVEMERVCVALGLTRPAIDTYCRKVHMQTWAKLNETEKAGIVDAIANGALSGPVAGAAPGAGDPNGDEAPPEDLTPA